MSPRVTTLIIHHHHFRVFSRQRRAGGEAVFTSPSVLGLMAKFGKSGADGLETFPPVELSGAVRVRGDAPRNRCRQML